MALDPRKSEGIFDKTGSGKKRMTDDKITKISESFAAAIHVEYPESPDASEAMLYALQGIEEDVAEIHRYLGAEVSTNVSTDLSVTTTSTGVKIVSSDGTNADISSASTTAAGILTATNFQNLNSASIAPPAEGTYHNGASEHLVWIPGTRFYGDNVVYAQGVVKAGTTKSVLYYDFAGIDKKKVTHAYAYTSTAAGKGLKIERWSGITGSTLATLANNVATNATQDITDWNCTPGESLNIQIRTASTSIELYGILLTLAKA